MHYSETDSAKENIHRFLRELFKRFEQEKIDYVIAREYKFLPKSLEGRDLDIHVKREDFQRSYKTVEEIAESYSALVLKIRQERAIWLFVVHAQPPFWGLRIDIAFPDSHTWRGCCYINLKQAMENKIVEQGIWKLREEDIIFMQFCRDILGRQILRKKYHKPIQNLYLADENKLRNELTKIFGRSYSNRLINLIKEGRFNNLGYISKGLRRAVMIRCILDNPLESARGIIQYFTWRCREFLKPNGVLIAVLGPDGSGKGTLIEPVQQEIEKILQFGIRTYHSRPSLLPSLGSLLLGRIEDGTPVTNPHGKKPSGIIGSTIRLAYYTLDYVLGYWILVRPYLGRKCIAVIFDRYFYDYYTDPIRYRVSLPRWIIKIFEAVVSKPDAVIFLSADPNVIHNRKAELSPEEIKKQLYESRKLIDRMKNSVWIDTAGSIVKSQEEMLCAILWTVERRLKCQKN